MTAADPEPMDQQEVPTPPSEVDKLQDQLLRLQADFENARKRWMRRQSEIQEAATAELVRDLLEVYDDFQRAIALGSADPGAGPLMTGVQMIAKRMDDLLKSYGVQPMESVGKPFDANFHEAVAHEPNNSVPESTVLAELRKGYLMNGRVLRHAVVKVAVALAPTS